MNPPAIEITIHRNRLSGEAEVRHLRGCIRAALLDKSRTKDGELRFLVVVKHSDVGAYLVGDDMMTETELVELSQTPTLVPLALITTV